MNQNSGSLRRLYVSNLSNNNRIVTYTQYTHNQLITNKKQTHTFQNVTKSIGMLPHTFLQSLGV